jgi:hypothetical protein
MRVTNATPLGRSLPLTLYKFYRFTLYKFYRFTLHEFYRFTLYISSYRFALYKFRPNTEGVDG